MLKDKKEIWILKLEQNMNENMDVTKYDVWRYRRCVETLERHYASCQRRGNCDGCDFDIPLDKVRYLSQ